MDTNKKKLIYWSMGIAFAPFIIILLLAVAIYIPPIQNFVVKQVASYASKETKMDIRVKSVNLVFPLKLGINGMSAIKQNDSLPQIKDTVANIHQAVAEIQLLPLFNKKIEIDRLEFNKMSFNTTNFIHEARVKGHVGLLAIEAHGIDLGKELIRINNAELKDANIDVALSDTVKEDTTESENFWKIYAEKLNIERTKATIHMPGDTMRIAAYMGKTYAANGFFNLYKGLYKVKSFAWKDGTLNYDNVYKGTTKGLDYNHLALSNINIGLRNIYYLAPQLSLNLTSCSFEEKSGIKVSQLQGLVAMDSLSLKLPQLNFRTPESNLTAKVNLNFNAFADKNPGKFDITLHGSFGKQDLMMFMGDMPSDFRKAWPNYPLDVDGVVKGNLRHADFAGLNIKLPTAFQIKTNGFINNITDTKRLSANVDVNAKTYNLDFISCLLSKEIKQTVNIPNGIGFDGNIKADGNSYASVFTLMQGKGKISGKASINADKMIYNADLNATAFPIQAFLPRMGLRPFSGTFAANGAGTDFLKGNAKLKANANVKSFGMSGYDFSNIKLYANIGNRKAHINLDSKNKLLKGTVTLDALINPKRVLATLGCDITNIDLYNLHITSTPIVAALCGHIDAETDMKETYIVKGRIGDVAVLDSNKLYRPEDDIVLDILTRRDTTHAIIDCGDFRLNMDAHGGYKKLMSIGNKFVNEINRQIDKRYIDQALLRKNLPIAHIALNTGSENFICRVLKKYGYSINNADMDLTSSPIGGLNGWLEINALNASGIQLDTIRLRLASDANEMTYQAQIRNNKKNPQYVFNALFNGGIHEHGTYLNGKIYDARNRLGISTGLSASMEEHGIRVTMTDTKPILGYKQFSINEDNYAFLGDDKRVSANLKMIADDGTGVQIYTDDTNTDALQDVTIGLHKFELEKITAVIPYMPKISGTMDGDFHLIQTPENITVSTAININKMVYEGSAMGNVGTEFVYMPKNDGTHHVDGYLTVNNDEVAYLKGTYDSKGEGNLDATLTMARTPLSLINGFIPDKLIGLKGYGEGELSVKGSLSKPQVNGEIYLDSSYLVSEPYGVELRFDNDPVRIVGSNLLFENFEMYSHNDQPLTLSGALDFSDLNRMMLNLRMRARNFQIIDAKENRRSETFGKAFVNIYAMINGPIDNLMMRGRLDVLGSTDMTYIMRDTPISTDNQLEGLVTFVDPRDTFNDDVTRPPLSGFNMDLSLSIDEGAHIIAQLNAEKTNYIDLEGGGDLRLQYYQNDLRLTGKYTLNNGEMKYSLPVIPLKTFAIQDGSSVEFTGDPMNPKLNITATETSKSSIGTGNAARQVKFECGVKITKTLKDMGLEFIIDAPEDLTLHSQLQSMSTEERGKLAVAMLTTGMYMAEESMGSFTMNSALSAFLNSQINSISNSAMRTLDLSFGVDNTTTATGDIQTDYSFKFAKRFWNNRLRIVVGGKLSTGSDAPNDNNTFFDNITFEYRLSDTSNKYINVFYNRNSYDWLEGNIEEFGAGFMWRRKLQHFNEIFKFKTKSDIIAPRDTTKKK
ncbi:MAG: translocation/assembly module TamB [Prevotella sp.]|nr:translocation/assembly module TamB [Prevotella sp.]